MRLHRSGRVFKAIAIALGMGEIAVRNAVEVTQAQGVNALAPKPTGRANTAFAKAG